MVKISPPFFLLVVVLPLEEHPTSPDVPWQPPTKEPIRSTFEEKFSIFNSTIINIIGNLVWKIIIQ